MTMFSDLRARSRKDFIEAHNDWEAEMYNEQIEIPSRKDLFEARKDEQGEFGTFLQFSMLFTDFH